MCLLQELCLISYLSPLALVVSFYWFWGSDDPILCTWYHNANILSSAQIMGSFTSVFRTLRCSLASARLKFSICSLALVTGFYWFWGSDDPILCLLYPNTKLNNAQIMGSFSSFYRTLLCSYHNTLFKWLVGSSWFNLYLLITCFNWYLLIACFSLCYVFVAYHPLAIFGSSI